MPAPGNASVVRSLQGRSAAAQRWGSPDKDDLARDYAEAKIADYITRTLATAPRLTVTQRARLHDVLSGGGSDAA